MIKSEFTTYLCVDLVFLVLQKPRWRQPGCQGVGARLYFRPRRVPTSPSPCYYYPSAGSVEKPPLAHSFPSAPAVCHSALLPQVRRLTSSLPPALVSASGHCTLGARLFVQPGRNGAVSI